MRWMKCSKTDLSVLWSMCYNFFLRYTLRLLGGKVLNLILNELKDGFQRLMNLLSRIENKLEKLMAQTDDILSNDQLILAKIATLKTDLDKSISDFQAALAAATAAGADTTALAQVLADQQTILTNLNAADADATGADPSAPAAPPAPAA